eukprot:1934044-Rhodomonas_salina.5
MAVCQPGRAMLASGPLYCHCLLPVGSNVLRLCAYVAHHVSDCIAIQPASDPARSWRYSHGQASQ